MAKKKVDAQTVKEIDERFAERMKASRRVGQVPEGAPRPPRRPVAHLLAGYDQNRPAQVGSQSGWEWQEDVVREERDIDIDMVGKMRDWYENER